MVSQDDYQDFIGGMMNWIKALLGIKPLKPIEIGSVWAIYPNNPFDPYEVAVIDVKNAYVRYAVIYKGKILKDFSHSMDEEGFRRVYRYVRDLVSNYTV